MLQQCMLLFLRNLSDKYIYLCMNLAFDILWQSVELVLIQRVTRLWSPSHCVVKDWTLNILMQTLRIVTPETLFWSFRAKNVLNKKHTKRNCIELWTTNIGLNKNVKRDRAKSPVGWKLIAISDDLTPSLRKKVFYPTFLTSKMSKSSLHPKYSICISQSYPYLINELWVDVFFFVASFVWLFYAMLLLCGEPLPRQCWHLYVGSLSGFSGVRNCRWKVRAPGL